MEKKLKENIKQALVSSNQTTLFTDSNSDSVLEEVCIAFLKYKGYRVVNPTTFSYNVKKLDDLIFFFYAMLDSRHPEYINAYRNLTRDRKIASLFLKNRIETTGSSKEVVLKECAAIIDTLFKYEKEFKFKTDIYFGMFGQKKLSWVTDKAIALMNKGTLRENEERCRQDLERIEKEQQANYDLGFNDNDIEAILSRMGE